MGPLVVGLAAGALGFLLGSLGNKKEEKGEKKPDPRLDQIMQSQQRIEGMLGQVLQNQQALFAGQAAIFGQGFMNQFCQCPAAMQSAFGGCRSPGQFLGQMDTLSISIGRFYG
jgi:hypothetical protein